VLQGCGSSAEVMQHPWGQLACPAYFCKCGGRGTRYLQLCTRVRCEHWDVANGQVEQGNRSMLIGSDGERQASRKLTGVVRTVRRLIRAAVSSLICATTRYSYATVHCSHADRKSTSCW